jgi:hypothetical protein
MKNAWLLVREAGGDIRECTARDLMAVGKDFLLRGYAQLLILIRSSVILPSSVVDPLQRRLVQEMNQGAIVTTLHGKLVQVREEYSKLRDAVDREHFITSDCDIFQKELTDKCLSMQKEIETYKSVLNIPPDYSCSN